MKTFAYRPASRQTGLWVMLILLGVAGEVAMVPLMDRWWGSGPVTFWTAAAAVMPLVLMIVVALLVSWLVNRRRRGGLEALLQKQGLQTNFTPAKEEKGALLAPVQHLFAALDLRDAPDGLDWMASGEESGGRMLVFEYRFTTGSGRMTQLHVRTIAAWPAGMEGLPGAPLGRLPGFVATRYPFLEHRAARKSVLDDPAFADLAPVWSLFGDAGTGARFLTPAVRRELSRSPKGESWCFGGDWICCVFRNQLDAKNLGSFLDRCRRILEMTG